MKASAAFAFSWLLFITLASCSEASIPNDTTEPTTPTIPAPASSPTIIAAGYCTTIKGLQVPGCWTDGVWNSLPTIGEHPANVVALFASGSDLYAGGRCWSGDSSTTQLSGYWKDGLWNGWGSQSITSIVISGSDIYAGGKFRIQGGSYGQVDAPGFWRNGTWSNLPTQSLYGASVTSMAAIDGHIYAGGYATVQLGNNPVTFRAYPGYWVDGAWNQLPDHGRGGIVSSLSTSNGSIYAGGVCNISTDLSEAGYWLNGNWVPLSSAISGARVSLIAVSGEIIYAYGRNGLTNGYWKNSTWTEISDQISVYAAAGLGDDVYLAGSKDNSGTPQPGYLKNGEWIALTPIDSTRGGQVTAIVILPKS